MTFAFLIALSVVIARLWQMVADLRQRIDMLESAGGGTVGGVPVTVGSEPEAVAAERPVFEPRLAREPQPEPQPEPMPQRMPEPIAVVQTAPDESVSARVAPSSGFEDLFGRRLPIWAGGITLAVAGFLIVRYSIDAGLLSPIVRIVMGLVFGTGLIVSAEVALRGEGVVRDARVRQALSGAGVATLYATILVAANLYHLVEPVTAFVAMALVTALAGGLSIRFGAPSAVLGLLGGLAAPALVGSDQPDVPLLTLYLALAVGGLCAVSRHQRWWWLGAAALAGGFGWGMLLILGGMLDMAGATSVGLYTLALGIGLPVLLVGERAGLMRLLGSLAACAQMAALVATGGFAPLHWGLFGLISVAMLWLSRRAPMLADVPAFGLGVAILLGFAWPGADAWGWPLAVMLAAMAAIYALPAALRVWRSDWRAIDASMVAATAMAVGVLPVFHAPGVAMPLPALAGAVLAAGVAALGWRVETRGADSRFATLTIVAAVLVALAAAIGLDDGVLAPVLALLALALQTIGTRGEDRRVERAAWAFGAGCVVVLMTISADVDRLFGEGPGADAMTMVRWLVPTAVAVVLTIRSSTPRVASVIQAVAVLLGYGAAAQVVPSTLLPVVPAAMMAGLALVRRVPVIAGIGAAAVLAIGWVATPLATWLAGAGGAIVGVPLYVADLPAPLDVLRLAPVALALWLVAVRVSLTPRVRHAALAIAVGFAGMTAHILYRQVFAIDGPGAFASRAMAERTLWEMLLAAAALAAWWLGKGRPRARRVAVALGGASLAHMLWFGVLVANPLWTRLDVGPWLVPAYATAFAMILTSRWALPRLDRPRGWATILLTLVFALSLLRQVAHGTMPLWLGTGAGEDIARSVLAIGLALGFLWVGIARASRDWRIASLALMLVAVAKVFLFDAAGLDGLLRIASFAALGFSLIGLGWLYSRYLPGASR